MKFTSLKAWGVLAAVAGSIAGQALAAEGSRAAVQVKNLRAPAVEARECVPGYLWLEAEAFANYGGWVLDTQFTHKMGSAYLLAAGVLKPLDSARTKLRIPRAGTWRVWARTKDWLPEFSPGVFTVAVNGQRGFKVGASRQEGWRWENAGEFTLASGDAEVALVDLAGAFARCDALLFTTDLAYTPANELAAVQAARARFTGASDRVEDGGTYDLVVAGAGPGGLGAAFAAARRGLRVALVHDRPVMGGNSSCEMGVTMEGAAIWGTGDLRESGLVCEATHRMLRHAGWSYSDAYREMADELKGKLFEFPNTRVLNVEKNGEQIAALIGRSTLDGRQKRFRGRLFFDGTGDGWIGYFAGAARMHGREARSEFNEAPAPEQRDALLMSGCIMYGDIGYQFRHTGTQQSYETPVWARVLPKGFVRHPWRMNSEWWVEHGGRFDELADPERARDELVRINFAYWGWIKNESRFKDKAADAVLTAMPFKNARREGYRLVGDYVLTANDALAGRMFPDRVSYGGWPLDTHDPLGMDNPHGNGYWRSHPNVPAYSIPFRCLYSKNVPNLLLGGRAVSVTHIALGSVRVQATLFQLGQAAGTAAALMSAKGMLPRVYGQTCMTELQQELLKDDQYIPQLANADPLDLARTAKVTSSSDHAGRRVLDQRDPLLQHPDNVLHDCAVCNRAAGFLRGELKALEAVNLKLVTDSDQAHTVTLNVYNAAKLGRGPMGRPLATLTAVVPAHNRGMVRFVPAKPIVLTQPAVWLEVPKTVGFSWALRVGTTGAGDFRAYGSQARWTPMPTQYAFVTEPALVRTHDSHAADVIDGVARPEGGVYHGWCSDPAQKLPQAIELAFPKPTTVRQVRLAFDTELSARHAAVCPQRLVKSYRVEGCVQGTWQTLATEADNQLRHRVHDFPAKTVTALRVVVEATWGDASARIFEIRAY